jgi:glycosyltransferase involved in cell wall biosynthesis
MTTTKIKILFVCNPDWSTNQRWMEMFADDPEFSIRAFSNGEGTVYPPQVWTTKTYTLFKPLIRQEKGKAVSLGLPRNRVTYYLLLKLDEGFHVRARLLNLVIRLWKPDIVHTIGMRPQAWITWQALQYFKKTRRPVWVVTSSSDDVFWERFRKGTLDNVQRTLSDCDGYLSDNQRDVKIAIGLGLRPDKVAFGKNVSTRGGMPRDVVLRARRTRPVKKPVILVPKGYEGVYHKPHVIMEALRLVHETRPDIEVKFLAASEDLRIWCGLLSEDLKRRVEFLDFLQQDEYLRLLSQARIMVAPSLTDGTPQCMLEAMSVGVFSIVSPHESIKEWITDGVNGFLVNPLNANEMAHKILIALEDDALLEKAREINFDIILNGYCTEDVREELIAYYKRMARRA